MSKMRPNGEDYLLTPMKSPNEVKLEIMEEFDKRFVYDLFDNTGLEILGNRQENRPVTDEEIQDFLSQSLNRLQDSIVENVEGLPEQTVDGAGDYWVLKHQVIELLKAKDYMEGER